MKTEDGLITPDGDLRIAILCDCEDCRKGIFHGWIMVSVRDGKNGKTSQYVKIDPASGPGRFLVDLSKYGGIRYEPYPFQAEFHGSSAPYGFLGGAAGPGKTTGSLLELFVAANEFTSVEGPHVHQLALRELIPNLKRQS